MFFMLMNLNDFLIFDYGKNSRRVSERSANYTRRSEESVFHYHIAGK
jgi:hypothetical protein